MLSRLKVPLKNGMATTMTSGMMVIPARTIWALAPPLRPLDPMKMMVPKITRPSMRLSRVELTSLKNPKYSLKLLSWR